MPGKGRPPVCASCGRRHRLNRPCERPPVPERVRQLGEARPVGVSYRGGKKGRRR